MKTIAIIFPYFGKFPSVFKLWWQSAINNPTVDFIFFTDQKIVSQSPNIHIHETTFSDLVKGIQAKYNFKLAIEKPYHICDFKAAYADIFFDYIKDYDFVGYGDVDLVYGDIRHFISDDVLDKYDMISGWGHLTLLRNNEYCRNFYKTKHEGFLYYEDVFSTLGNFGFDEYWHNGLADLWVEMHPDKVYNCDLLIDDLRIPTINYNFCGSTRRVFENNNVIYGYEGGKLFRYNTLGDKITKEQTLYVHLKRRKDVVITTKDLNNWLLVPPHNVISVEDVTLKKMVKWCNRRLLLTTYRMYLEKIKWHYKALLNK